MRAGSIFLTGASSKWDGGAITIKAAASAIKIEAPRVDIN